MLIASDRHTAADLDYWRVCEAMDAANAARSSIVRHEERAMLAICEFFARVPDAYVSVSWGKDSVVVLHLAERVVGRVRCVWFPAGEIENPDCSLVRDAFLREYDVDYAEQEASRTEVTVEGHDGAQEDFEVAARAYGKRYLSGVRSEESTPRKKRMKRWGESTKNTCAPIGWWRHEEVFAYLHKYRLPVHPAYACTMGGRYPREDIRVSTIGGYRGSGFGRREWESVYYGDVVSRVFGSLHVDGTV